MKSITEIQRIIQCMEEDLAEARISLRKEVAKNNSSVRPGDLIQLIRNYEWVGDAGTKMRVKSVELGHIMCVPLTKPPHGIYWIGDGDYVKVK